MKASENFKNVIKEKLDEMAANDELFAKSYKKENKNIDDCLKYILNTVKKSGVQGWADDEIFGMAAHYYDEDDIKVGNEVKCRVVINREIQLTEAEKKQAKEKAIEREIAEQREKMQKRSAKKLKGKEQVTEQTLF